MDEGYDLVIGSRFVGQPKGVSMRMIGSRLISWAIRLTTGESIADPTSGMRMFNREMIKEFALNINYGPEPDTVSFLIKQGARVAEVPVTIAKRTGRGKLFKASGGSKIYGENADFHLLIQNFRMRQ